ncbi:MAG: hypothetical protein WC415_06835 [Patescibacteria group bacterium]|jgi:hypothetical protein
MVIAKPFFKMSKKNLEDKFKELGFDCELIGKPTTFDNLISDHEGSFNLDRIEQDSKNRIYSYLEDVGADGALIVHIVDYGRTTKVFPPRGIGNITLLPYKLTHIEKDK